MGDLMNERNTMSSLYSKYQGFSAPASRILVGESRRDLAAELGLQTESLNLSLSLDTASSASFTLVNVYDSEKSSFRSSALDILYLGNVVKVEIGYGSKLERVFTGFIYSVRTDFDDTASISVTALDIRRVMEESVRRGAVWNYTTYSDVFRHVMEPYKKLYSRLSVDDTEAGALPSFMQNESDLAFVKRLATEGNREFFVFDDTVYFRKRKKRSPAVTLTWGQDLISFSRESIYADERVNVLGLLRDSKEPVSASKDVKTDRTARQIVSGGLSRNIASPSSDTKDKASEKAARIAEELMERKQSGHGSCVGMPQLVPGRPVTVAGLSKQINGDYVLRSVTHNFGADGFWTSFQIGGFY